MRRLRSLAVVTVLASASLAAQPLDEARGRPLDEARRGPADIDVRTGVSQTALWVGNVVTYTVTLTCRPDVDVLQEDLGADKLTLEGVQVVGHTIDRRITSDGHTQYTVAYRLTTFEPVAESIGIGDWTVRYVVGIRPQGGSAPARELRIPGAALAWRSALPAALNTLEIRSDRALDPAPRWWRATRPAGIGLLGGSVVAFGWLLFRRLSAGRPRKTKRRDGRQSARDLQNTCAALREADVTSAPERLAAYGTLEAAVRRHASDLTGLPASALTPAELRDRLSTRPASVSAEAIDRILSECQRARYQPAGRLPDERQFHATLEAATDLVAAAR